MPNTEEKLARALTKMEEAVCDARNLAFMLTATMETDDSFYGEDKTNAVCYGVYQMEDRMRAVKEAYYKLHDEISECRKESDESLIDMDDATVDVVNKKVVNLH